MMQHGANLPNWQNFGGYYDMTQWPPDGAAGTLSWLFCPLIIHVRLNICPPFVIQMDDACRNRWNNLIHYARDRATANFHAIRNFPHDYMLTYLRPKRGRG
jgi:hypothetical protein